MAIGSKRSNHIIWILHWLMKTANPLSNEILKDSITWTNSQEKSSIICTYNTKLLIIICTNSRNNICIICTKTGFGDWLFILRKEIMKDKFCVLEIIMNSKKEMRSPFWWIESIIDARGNLWIALRTDKEIIIRFQVIELHTLHSQMLISRAFGFFICRKDDIWWKMVTLSAKWGKIKSVLKNITLN